MNDGGINPITGEIQARTFAEGDTDRREQPDRPEQCCPDWRQTSYRYIQKQITTGSRAGSAWAAALRLLLTAMRGAPYALSEAMVFLHKKSMGGTSVFRTEK